MLPVEQVIGDRGLVSSARGACLDVRLPWYRSLPLSTVAIESVEVDGVAVPLDTIRFELNGTSWSLVELAEQTDTFWFVLDTAGLVMPGIALQPGSEHSVAASIAIYPPYIPGMKRLNTQTAVLSVGHARAGE